MVLATVAKNTFGVMCLPLPFLITESNYDTLSVRNDLFHNPVGHRAWVSLSHYHGWNDCGRYYTYRGYCFLLFWEDISTMDERFRYPSLILMKYNHKKIGINNQGWRAH